MSSTATGPCRQVVRRHLTDLQTAVHRIEYDAADSTLAITGGTGKWRQARGERCLHARDAKGNAYDFTFRVDN